MILKPGFKMVLNLPRRSMIFVSDCGMITIVFFNTIIANTTMTIRKVVRYPIVNRPTPTLPVREGER